MTRSDHHHLMLSFGLLGLIGLIGLIGLATAGCAADLGIAPVFCDPAGECPGGYRCVDSPRGNVCVREGYALDDDPDAANLDAASLAATNLDWGPLGATPDGGPAATTPDGAASDGRASDGESDTPAKDRAPRLDGAIVQPATGCLDEPFEPNNARLAATPLTHEAGLIPRWEICYPGDVDLFEISLAVGDQLSVQITFTHANGDLEAALFDPGGVLLAEGRSTSDDEDFTLVAAAAAGKYLVAVWGFAGAVNTYDLQLN